MRTDTPCQICGKVFERCTSANRLVPNTMRHDYEPSAASHYQVVAPLPERNRQQRGPRPAGWRHQQDSLIGGHHE